MPTPTSKSNGWAVTDARNLAQIAGQAYRESMGHLVNEGRIRTPPHVLTHIAVCAGLTWAAVLTANLKSESAVAATHELAEALDAALDALRTSEVVHADGVDAAASLMERFLAESV